VNRPGPLQLSNRHNAASIITLVSSATARASCALHSSPSSSRQREADRESRIHRDELQPAQLYLARRRHLIQMPECAPRKCACAHPLKRLRLRNLRKNRQPLPKRPATQCFHRRCRRSSILSCRDRARIARAGCFARTLVTDPASSGVPCGDCQICGETANGRRVHLLLPRDLVPQRHYLMIHRAV